MKLYGRFTRDSDTWAESFRSSVAFDRRLAACDIAGSIAHAEMLASCGLISESDAAAIVEGLKGILADIEAGRFEFDPALEDVHMNVEAALTQRIGQAGERLHTARSRNDQVATDERLYLREAIDDTTEAIIALVRALLVRGREHAGAVMPSYTHLQRAQPSTLGHHLLAHAWAFVRDAQRLADCRRRANLCPLGAGAVAGTTLPIDRRQVAKRLGFDGIVPNSIDAVSDRDYLIEAMAAFALIACHASRLCEELVLWSSQEFGYVRIPEELCSSSSMMPQKRNPDLAELVRGKTGRVYGDLLGLLVTMKGLPLSYNMDMQEDKERFFDALDTVTGSLAALERMVRGAQFDLARLEEAAGGGGALATDLAEYLVGKGMPFRSAHRLVGQLVARLEQEGRDIATVTAEELAAASELFGSDAVERLDARFAVSLRSCEGGPAPERVLEQADRLEEWIESAEEELRKRVRLWTIFAT